MFPSHIKKKETPPSKSNSPNMSSPRTVVKSKTTQKPLHNFSLPDLKWAMNHANTTRFRNKPSDSSRKSPRNDTVSDKHKQTHHNHNQKKIKSPVLKTGDGIEKLAKRKSNGDDVAQNLWKKPAAAAAGGSSSGDGSRSKIFIRIKTKTSKVADDVANAGDHNSVFPDDGSDDLLVPKSWSFRTRKLVTKIHNGNNNNNVNGGVALRIGGGAAPEVKVPEKKDRDKEKEKMKFSISLKKEEIEDDFFAMTGTKPSRRPKKRAKNVQKQLDYVFPGLWLASITPDSYKVNDGTKKVKG